MGQEKRLPCPPRSLVLLPLLRVARAVIRPKESSPPAPAYLGLQRDGSGGGRGRWGEVTARCRAGPPTIVLPGDSSIFPVLWCSLWCLSMWTEKRVSLNTASRGPRANVTLLTQHATRRGPCYMRESVTYRDGQITAAMGAAFGGPRNPVSLISSCRLSTWGAGRSPLVFGFLCEDAFSSDQVAVPQWPVCPLGCRAPRPVASSGAAVRVSCNPCCLGGIRPGS